MNNRDFIDKKALSERDICTKFITPAIREVSGWNDLQFFEEFTLGKIHVRGKRVARGVRDRAVAGFGRCAGSPSPVRKGGTGEVGPRGHGGSSDLECH